MCIPPTNPRLVGSSMRNRWNGFPYFSDNPYLSTLWMLWFQWNQEINSWFLVSNIWIIFPYIGNVLIPTDFHSLIFQRGKYTTNQMPLKFPLDPIKPPLNAIKMTHFKCRNQLVFFGETRAVGHRGSMVPKPIRWGRNSWNGQGAKECALVGWKPQESTLKITSFEHWNHWIPSGYD